MGLDDWIMSHPKEDRVFVAQTIAEIQDVFKDLEQKKLLRTTLRSEEKKDFPEILRTSNGLFDVFNMLFDIQINSRSKEFVLHNKEYGFTESRYLYLLFSESMSAFLRSVELFRACFLLVLNTGKKENGYQFSNTMTIGTLLNELVSTCGEKGTKIQNKIEWELRNALTHGLVWQKGFDIHYTKDITFAKPKLGKINVFALQKKGIGQSKITQCLIETIADWYEVAP